MYNSILLPIDGSDPSGAATAHARNLGRSENAGVDALHVIEQPYTGVAGGPIPRAVTEEFEADAEALIDRTLEALNGLDAHASIQRGMPAETISSYADDRDIDLIVMGTHGRSGVSRMLLGSTIERTLRLAHSPVLAVESPPPGQG